MQHCMITRTNAREVYQLIDCPRIEKVDDTFVLATMVLSE